MTDITPHFGVLVVPATFVYDDDDDPLQNRDAMDHVADDEVCVDLEVLDGAMPETKRRKGSVASAVSTLPSDVGVGAVSRRNLDSMAERIERGVSKAVADSSISLHQSISRMAAAHENLGKEFHTYKVDVDKRLTCLEKATPPEARVLELARNVSPVRAQPGLLGNQSAAASSCQQKQESDDLCCLAVGTFPRNTH
eukprot:6464205-Amphidinium_carterae.1